MAHKLEVKVTETCPGCGAIHEYTASGVEVESYIINADRDDIKTLVLISADCPDCWKHFAIDIQY